MSSGYGQAPYVPHAPWSEDPARTTSKSSIEEDVPGLHQSIETLHGVIGGLQKEMDRLRRENNQLRQRNGALVIENQRLAAAFDDLDNQRSWSSFDIVEEHYRQLERHRAHVEQGELYVPNDADEAAGTKAAQPTKLPSFPPPNSEGHPEVHHLETEQAGLRS